MRRRGLMAAAVAAIIITSLIGGAPRRVVAAPSSADDCPDILFLGARGSGERPQPPYSVGNDPTGQLGLGETLWNSFKALRLAVPGLQVEAEGVNYNPTPVFPNGDTPTNLVDHPGYYVEGVSLGATEFVRVLRERIAECGDITEYVLAGYSQGAWALHWALADLNPNERERIAAVLMFGDPLLNPASPAVRMAKRHGGRGAAFVFSPPSTRRTYVPADLVSRTASYCLPGDPVCQPIWAIAHNPLVVVNCAQEACAHLDYVLEGVDERAARVAVRLVRPLSRQVAVATTSLADAQVGVPYTATLAARRGRPPYRWRILSGRPAWLTLDSATGTLSGKPGTAQTLRLRVQVQDARGSVGQAFLRLIVRRPAVTFSIARVDTTDTGAQLQWGGISALTVSAEGRYVLFQSEDAVLPGLSSGIARWYRKDMRTGTIVLASAADHVSDAAASISDNGQVVVSVVFLPDGNRIDVRNLALGSVVALPDPTSSDGLWHQNPDFPTLSGNGKWVVFTTGNAVWRSAVPGTPATIGSGSYIADISDDGDVVAAASRAVADGGVTVRRMSTGTSQHIAGASSNFALSGDGGTLIYNAPVADPSCDQCFALYARDLASGAAVRVTEPGIYGTSPAVSSDGTMVAYGSTISGQWQIWVTNRTTGCREIASRNADGLEGDMATGAGGGVALSADGTTVTFSSGASNLVPEDTNNSLDAFAVTGTCWP